MSTSSTTGSTGRRSGRGGAQTRRTGTDRVAEVAETSTRRHSAIVGFAIGLVLAVAVAFLIAQNGRDAPMSWLVWDMTAPLWILVAVAFVAGFVAGPLMLAGFKVSHDRRRQRLDLIHRAQS